MHTYIYRITWTGRLSRPGSSRMGGLMIYGSSVGGPMWGDTGSGSPLVLPQDACAAVVVLWRVAGVLGPGSWGHVLCLCLVVALALSWSCVCHHLFLCRPDLGRGFRGATTLTHTRTDGWVDPGCYFYASIVFFVFLFTCVLWSWFRHCCCSRCCCLDVWMVLMFLLFPPNFIVSHRLALFFL